MRTKTHEILPRNVDFISTQFQVFGSFMKIIMKHLQEACKQQQQQLNITLLWTEKRGLNYQVVSFPLTTALSSIFVLLFQTTFLVVSFVLMSSRILLSRATHALSQSIRFFASLVSLSSTTLPRSCRSRREMKYFYTRVDRIVVVAFTEIRKKIKK